MILPEWRRTDPFVSAGAMRHARGVTFTGCATPLTGTDSRPAVATMDVTGLTGSCAP